MSLYLHAFNTCNPMAVERFKLSITTTLSFPISSAANLALFIDDDKTAYFYYSRDCSENVVDGVHTSQIYVAKLSDDLTKIVSEPKFLFGATEDFECKHEDKNWRWNEGPYMLKKNGRYYLSYSANCYATRHYCICLAISDKPDCDFKKVGAVLTCNMVESDFSGPGHNAFFVDEKGKLKTSFHIHTYENAPSFNRKAVICDVDVAENTIIYNVEK